MDERKRLADSQLAQFTSLPAIWFLFAAIIILTWLIYAVVQKGSEATDEVQKHVTGGTAVSGEIGLLLELHGVMECLVAEQDAKKGAVVKARWRTGRVTSEIARTPTALRDVKKGDALAIVVLNSGKSIVFPSELCKGALSFEISPEMMSPDDIFSEIPELPKIP